MKPPIKTNSDKLFILLTVFIYAGLISSCEDKTTNQRWYVPKEQPAAETSVIDSTGLWGHWVCKDFVDLTGARRSVRFVRNRPMFLELVFDPSFGDSVLLITAYEDFYAPWEKSPNNEILIKNIVPGKNIVLNAPKGAKGLTLSDTLDNRGAMQIHNWTFEKAPANYVINDGVVSSAIGNYINHVLFEGDYLQAGGSGIPVTFGRNGTISGWPLYNKYRVCLGGACFRLTPATLDIVQLIGTRNIDYYAFFGNAAADSIYLYRLEGGTPEKEYSYKTSDLTYTLGKLPQ